MAVRQGYLVEAVSTLRGQGQRSFLAVLGISIGVAAIVAMLSIGHMVQVQTEALFKHLGVDLLEFQTGPNVTPPVTLRRSDIDRLPSRLHNVVASTPLVVRRLSAASGASSSDLTMVGVTPSLGELVTLSLQRGRFIGPADESNFVAVVGSEAAKKLASSRDGLTLQSLVSMGGYDFTVIGLLKSVPYTALDPADLDNSILIPIGLVSRVSSPPSPDAALTRVRPGADASAVGGEISIDLARGQVGLQTLSARDLIGGLQAQQAIHHRLLAAIGGVSLLVGGVGTTNVMLMSVMERRREIGLRAALGATPLSLQAMFLAEASILALLGAGFGLLLGLIIAFVVSKLSAWNFSVAMSGLIVGPVMGLATGVLSGLYPAVRASRLDPLEALRSDS